MAVRHTIEITRPSAAISFYSFDDTTEKYIETNYTKTNKRTLVSISVSRNSLVKTLVYDFTDNDTLQEFLNDSSLTDFFNSRDSHYVSNGITITTSAENV